MSRRRQRDQRDEHFGHPCRQWPVVPSPVAVCAAMKPQGGVPRTRCVDAPAWRSLNDCIGLARNGSRLASFAADRAPQKGEVRAMVYANSGAKTNQALAVPSCHGRR